VALIIYRVVKVYGGAMSGKNIPLIPFLKPNSNNIDPNNPRVLK
jgi:hypothetical protein